MTKYNINKKSISEVSTSVIACFADKISFRIQKKKKTDEMGM